jgi:hypothetical protein
MGHGNMLPDKLVRNSGLICQDESTILLVRINSMTRSWIVIADKINLGARVR